MKKNSINKKELIFYWAAGIASVILAMPFILYTFYSNDLVSSMEVPESLVITSTLIQSAILLGLMVWGGLAANNLLGFNTKVALPGLKESSVYILKGLSIGFVLIILDYIFHNLGTDLTFYNYTFPPVWKGFLACFYGGVSEELMMRLFLVNIIGLVIIKIRRNKAIDRSSWLWYIPIIIAALIFAAGHLPVAAIQAEMNLLLVLRVLLFNSLAGVIFGYIYLKNGLIPAIITHFFADFMIYVVFASVM